VGKLGALVGWGQLIKTTASRPRGQTGRSWHPTQSKRHSILRSSTSPVERHAGRVESLNRHLSRGGSLDSV
jgi:hypothetical protein